MPSPYLAIVGPTASGKTEAALRLARERNAEIISADSRQVYRRLLVGTAKPSGTWRDGIYWVEGVAYHLVDCCDPTERFSAGTFVKESLRLVQEIEARGRVPIFAGGTGLYLSALAKGLAPLPSADGSIRDELHAMARLNGCDALHEQLRQVDPVSASAIPKNNVARLVRALEVYRLTGRPLSTWHAEHRAAGRTGLDLQCIGLDVDRETLNQRIAARCRGMIEGGMIEEAKALLDSGIPKDAPALTGLGYPRIVTYLEGGLSKEELLDLLVQDTRQYAKRQGTWFRHQLPVIWKKSLP